MTSAVDIQRFLDAMSEVERSWTQGATRGSLPFITISRQSGAGGHSLSDTLIRLMEQEKDKELFQGWQIFDQRLCEILAQDSKLEVSMQSLLSEEYRSQIQEFVLGLFGRQSDQYLVAKKMFETIRSLATVGKVIIVGRGGSQVTRKLELGVHVRLAAPETLRIQHMMKRLHQSEEEARRMVHKQDEDRARLLKSHFQVNIDDPLLYDVTWNTGTVAFDAVAEAIVVLVKQRMKEKHAETSFFRLA